MEGHVVCPHHACPPSWDFTPYRVNGRISIVFRFDCCDYVVQVNGLPVPGIHEPLPERPSPTTLSEAQA